MGFLRPSAAGSCDRIRSSISFFFWGRLGTRKTRHASSIQQVEQQGLPDSEHALELQAFAVFSVAVSVLDLALAFLGPKSVKEAVLC